MLSAKRNNLWLAVTGSFVTTALTLWGMRHIEAVLRLNGKDTRGFEVIFFFAFFMLCVNMLLMLLERTYKTTPQQDRELDKLRVVVNVPVCNEDPSALRDCILSILGQTRKPHIVHVVVNGLNTVDYSAVRETIRQAQELYKTPVTIHWVEQAIPGKRQAQARTARDWLRPGDIFLTIDSDAYLDAHAIEEGLKPLANKKIQSVAGIVLTQNNRDSFLTRMSDLWFLGGQLIDRSAASTMGAVIVNSGVLAFYRAEIILDNLEGYINETFFGRHIEFSDDSLLTLYALQRGKAVQQPTSFAFTLMPTNLSHHFRQQMRWMRGAFIRSWWRFKYLPLTSYAYWQHFMGWVQFFISLGMFGYLFAYMPVIDHRMLPWLLFVPLMVGYGQGLRYLTVSRSDESFWYRLGTYLCQPIPSLWSYFVLRFLRYYCMATCLKTGWGTRQSVEVTAQGSSQLLGSETV